MFKKVNSLWSAWCEKGIKLPYAFDPETNKPSITLMFFWVTSILSIISLILLHLNLVSNIATTYSLVFIFSAFIMYRLRKLDKVKIDVENKSIELDNKGNNDDAPKESSDPK